ncbi:hypothetical protein JYU34_006380 [Plutella xylostella]|uniref:Uncharacterized protein n=1 Tax=Plutella xylostella TaxID=51655 RepID=A0ABQ7QRX7_PLUXY|nr:hypothetical protein JYU34_006380 [Plutella xylostella]
MAKGVGKPPQSTWGRPCSTGRKETISASRTLSGLRRIPCAAGAPSPRACATTGAAGGAPTPKTHSRCAQ